MGNLKHFALPLVTVGLLAAVNVQHYLFLWLTRDWNLSDDALLHLDRINHQTALWGIGLMIVGAILWFAERQPFSWTDASETRRGYVASAVANVAFAALVLSFARRQGDADYYWMTFGWLAFAAIGAWQAVRVPSFKRPAFQFDSRRRWPWPLRTMALNAVIVGALGVTLDPPVDLAWRAHLTAAIGIGLVILGVAVLMFEREPSLRRIVLTPGAFALTIVGWAALGLRLGNARWIVPVVIVALIDTWAKIRFQTAISAAPPAA